MLDTLFVVQFWNDHVWVRHLLCMCLIRGCYSGFRSIGVKAVVCIIVILLIGSVCRPIPGCFIELVVNNAKGSNGLTFVLTLSLKVLCLLLFFLLKIRE